MAGSAKLVDADFDDLDGFLADDHLAAWRGFLASARATLDGRPPLRPAKRPAEGLRRALLGALGKAEPQSGQAALEAIRSSLRPYRIDPEPGAPGFLTGYYEPSVQGSLKRTAEFRAPILGRPSAGVHAGPGLSDRPGPVRRDIELAAESGTPRTVVWLEDWVEVFLIQVQGSGRVLLPDGRTLRLIYDGRNGRAYTSIGRILVEEGEIPAAEMSLDRLKGWVRRHGQEAGDRGRVLLWRNESYVYFRPDWTEAGGPIGGQGLRLEPLRSIAVDRTLWPYGLIYWLEADLPWRTDETERFGRLVIGQDTGSAILGPARADLFFGSGAAAGRRAGSIRHECRLFVLLPPGSGGLLGAEIR